PPCLPEMLRRYALLHDTTMNRIVLISGIVISAALIGVLFLNLGHDPSTIDSPLIGKPAPNFALKAVGTGETIDVAKLRGKPAIIHLWAAWGGPCSQA